MSQKLILPFKISTVFSAAYKNDKYFKYYKTIHYGTDCYTYDGSRIVYGCGNGTVISAGMDGDKPNQKFGNAVVIVYPNVVLHNKKIIPLLACRMYHFDELYVKAGDKITKNTKIGLYGSTGALVDGKHLHIEFDTDGEYPAYAYHGYTNGKVIKYGTVDSTIDPIEQVFYLELGQSVSKMPNGDCITDNQINKLKKYTISSPIIENGGDNNIMGVIYKGIDISKYQTITDWNLVKNNTNFIIIRIGICYNEGSLKLDSKFDEFTKACISNNIDYGYYLYSYALNGEAAKKAAEEIHSILKIRGYKPTYPIAFDIEDPTLNNLSKKVKTDTCYEFCSKLEELGYYSSIYASLSYFNNQLDLNRLTRFDKWIARWVKSYNDSMTSGFSGSHGMWQYMGNDGRLPGISGPVDLNVSYKNYPSIIKSNNLNGWIKEPDIPTPPPVIDPPIVEPEPSREKYISIDNVIKSLKDQGYIGIKF